MALLTELIGRTTQQFLLPGLRLMGLMASQAITFEKRLMQGRITFFPQPLFTGLHLLKLMTAKTKRACGQKGHTPIVAGVG